MISLILVLIDTIIVSFVPFLILMIRFEGQVESQLYNRMFDYLPEIILFRLSIFYVFGLYHRLWRYASIHELLLIIGAVSASSLFIITYGYFTDSGLPRSVHLLSWIFNIMLIGASRLMIRVVHYIMRPRNGNTQTTHVLIVGAGDAGAMIARELKERYCETKKIIGFIDDDQYKINQMLFGAKVLGARKDISHIVHEHSITEIIIAMPSIKGETLRDIIHECKNTKSVVKILPGMYELIDGKVTVQQLRSVDVEDLLRREPVHLELGQIAKYLTNKSVMVTGAGGSIGSELCRQIARMSPKTLLLLGKGENSIYEIDRELKAKHSDLNILPIIADVRDVERINDIFAEYKPQVVFHAAAHKHVPLMEAEPVEAVKNNIFGTKAVAEAADRINVEIFVMISTDKAVNPTSVMGATKRVAELIIQNISRISKTKFVAVRFGNVLGSRGSVVPLFKRQIALGGPITITHPDMTRYFMTIPEASQLVLQAGAMSQGGEVFVLDMGKPVKIIDMACDLIELSGLVPHKDIKLKYTGLRPGEKMFEELLTVEEGTSATKHEKIFIANPEAIDEKKLQQGLVELRRLKKQCEIISVISKLVPTYKNASQEPIKLNTSEIIWKKEEKSQREYIIS